MMVKNNLCLRPVRKDIRRSEFKDSQNRFGQSREKEGKPGAKESRPVLWPFRLFEQIHGKRFLPGVYRRN